MEDALYEIVLMRLFARSSLDQLILDCTIIMNFRHLLEQLLLTRQLFAAIKQWLSEVDIMMAQGSLVDATFIEATKTSRSRARHNGLLKNDDQLAMLFARQTWSEWFS